MPTYAGIGSRRTPQEICELMTRIARYLRGRGYTLTSGHADAADQAFERGAGDAATIFLPWPDFNESVSIDPGALVFDQPTKEARLRASEDYSIWWSHWRASVRSLIARNYHQVLGIGLDDPVESVICWTPDGRRTGGTAYALSLAERNRIRVYNLANELDREQVERTMKEYA